MNRNERGRAGRSAGPGEPGDSRDGWTLEELGARVARALASDYPGPANGQVRATPDARPIRYYASLGLLARPRAHRGRTALYGRRHLLQLVAIKRLQAQGLSLATVQERLLGASDDSLEALARVPATLAASEAGSGSPRRRSFWRERPPAATESAAPARSAAAAQPMTLVPLEGAAVLLVPGPLSAEELERILVAARPLCSELRVRGATTQPKGGDR